MKFGNIKEKLAVANNSKKVINFFYWNISWVLLLILLVLSGYCIFVWYQYVYRPHWSESQVETYKSSKNTSAAKFDKTGFQAVMDEKKARENDYQKTFDDAGDIFRLKTTTATTNTKQK